MIITKQKELERLLDSLKDEKRVYLVGCGQCASLCKTGGSEELDQMEEILTNEGKEVTGKLLMHAACHELDLKRNFRINEDVLKDTDSILVLSCGAAVASAIEAAPEKKVHPACDTLFLGNSFRQLHFRERCSMCGECVVDNFEGICPVTRCPKGLLNGPCGGVSNGMCEVDTTRPCAWVNIYDRMKTFGELDKFNKIAKPKNWRATPKPGISVPQR